MEDPERTAIRTDLREMTKLLEDGLSDGAFRLSSGLSYPDSMQTQPSLRTGQSEAHAERVHRPVQNRPVPVIYARPVGPGAARFVGADRHSKPLVRYGPHRTHAETTWVQG